MVAQGDWYGNAQKHAWSDPINFPSDTIKCAVLGAGYTPNLATHAFWSDVSASEAAGAGYTAGGQALAGKAVTFTAANSWATAWAALTAYTVGQVIRPATGNGHLYVCTVAGTSAASAPTWPTGSASTVTDGSVTWAEIGQGVTVLSATNPSWANATLTGSYAVVYKDTGTAATSPLIGLLTFASSTSSTNGTFSVAFDAALGIVYDTFS